jgi:hypothetical protein
MNLRSIVFRVAVVTPCAVFLAGCASPPVAPPKEPPRVIVPADGGRPVTAAELDELTRAFADRYVGLLYSACDTVKKDNPDPLQRREAQALLVDSSSNIYDIASNADSFTRLLDLVVVTRLMSQVWMDDGRCQHVFGDRGQPLTSAMLHARAEAWALAARVLAADQLDALDSLLVDWREENPEMIHVSFVRFSNFAIGRGRSAASDVLAGGFLAQVGQAGQAVDEARLLGERMFYQAKREPTLLRWQAAAAKEDLLATPQVGSALADVHRLTDQLEQLPAHVAAEREALLAAVDSRLASADASVAKVKDVVAETRTLVESLEPASKSLDQLIKSADTLFARYDAWDRWAVANEPRPFDIREYTEIVKESATTSQQLSEMLKSSNDLLASPAWRPRLDELNRSADGRIQTMAGEGRLLIDEFYRRLYIALGALFALLIAYRIASILLMRRLGTDDRAHRTRIAPPRQGGPPTNGGIENGAPMHSRSIGS